MMSIGPWETMEVNHVQGKESTTEGVEDNHKMEDETEQKKDLTTKVAATSSYGMEWEEIPYSENKLDPFPKYLQNYWTRHYPLVSILEFEVIYLFRAAEEDCTQ